MKIVPLEATRRIFGPKRKEVARGWRKLCNEELHNLYGSPNIEMRWAVHVACREARISAYSTWLENLNGRDYSEDRVLDGMIILEWILGQGVD